MKIIISSILMQEKKPFNKGYLTLAEKLPFYLVRLEPVVRDQLRHFLQQPFTR